ncbi:hypothetical protein [Kitasatospora sp. NPDC093806]|uniref:hypothetical protein n=1 Tax=Kitasatospora sp. NPDC093806 TaxID=3155075 RepID=UPI00341B2BA6
MKRAFGVLAALLLLGGVAFALLRPTGDDLVTVKGVIGSEKREFFEDPEVKAELAKQGIKVSADSAGSWQMSDINLDDRDFAFPASQAAAESIQAKRGLTGTLVRPFYSPLVIMAHVPTANVLVNAGMATRDETTGVVTFKMDELLKALRQSKRWEQLEAPDKPGDLGGDIFLTTTDPATSSSGALYVSVLSYLLNGRQVVADEAGVQKVKGDLYTAFSKQGGLKKSTDEPFADFLSNAGGPLVLAYESQAAELVVKGKAPADLTVLYPDTTIVSDHTIVGLTANGRKLADQLNTNAKLRELAAKYGFRPREDPAAFAARVKGKKQPPYLAADLTAANIKQAPVPVPDILAKLTNTAKGK